MINFFDISKKPHKEESTRIHELKNFKKPKKALQNLQKKF